MYHVISFNSSTNHVASYVINPDTQLPTPTLPLWITDMITGLGHLPNWDVGSTSYLGNTPIWKPQNSNNWKTWWPDHDICLRSCLRCTDSNRRIWRGRLGGSLFVIFAGCFPLVWCHCLGIWGELGQAFVSGPISLLLIVLLGLSKCLRRCSCYSAFPSPGIAYLCMFQRRCHMPWFIYLVLWPLTIDITLCISDSWVCMGAGRSWCIYFLFLYLSKLVTDALHTDWQSDPLHGVYAPIITWTHFWSGWFEQQSSGK